MVDAIFDPTAGSLPETGNTESGYPDPPNDPSLVVGADGEVVGK